MPTICGENGIGLLPIESISFWILSHQRIWGMEYIFPGNLFQIFCLFYGVQREDETNRAFLWHRVLCRRYTRRDYPGLFCYRHKLTYVEMEKCADFYWTHSSWQKSLHTNKFGLERASTIWYGSYIIWDVFTVHRVLSLSSLNNLCRLHHGISSTAFSSAVIFFMYSYKGLGRRRQTSK